MAVTRFGRDEPLADADLADYGHWVAVHSRSGRVAAHLGIVPHPLVPEASPAPPDVLTVLSVATLVYVLATGPTGNTLTAFTPASFSRWMRT